MSEPEENAERKPLKVVVVGDSAVGKTCMLLIMTGQPYPDEWIPTVLDATSIKYNTSDEVAVTLNLWDTEGHYESNRLRPFAYPDTDVFLVCFSLAAPAPETFGRVESYWIPEINLYCPGVPYILVGTKSDLREDTRILEHLKIWDQAPITFEQGLAKAKAVKAVDYMEISSIRNHGVNELVERLTQIALAGSAAPRLQPRKDAKERLDKCETM